jgi:hypothetical protein
MDLTALSEIEIKAMVYDRLAFIENAQREIQMLNQELAARKQTKPPAEESE